MALGSWLGEAVSSWRIARCAVLLSFALVATIGLFGDSAAHAAGGGYGPGISGPGAAPGGFSSVVTTHAFGATGGTVSANVPGGEAELGVPDGAFGQSVQALITAPDLSGINAVLPQLGFGGYTAIGGVGITIDDLNGQPISGQFVHPLNLTITGSGIGAGDLLVEFTSLSTAATLQDAVFTDGSVTVSLSADPDFAVLAPSTAASSAASTSPSSSGSSAPTAVLGEQFTKGTGGSIVGKTLFAVVVVLVVAIGAMMLTLRRRRPNSFTPRHSSAGAPAKQRRGPPPSFAPKHARS